MGCSSTGGTQIARCASRGMQCSKLISCQPANLSKAVLRYSWQPIRLTHVRMPDRSPPPGRCFGRYSSKAWLSGQHRRLHALLVREGFECERGCFSGLWRTSGRAAEQKCILQPGKSITAHANSGTNWVSQSTLMACSTAPRSGTRRRTRSSSEPSIARLESMRAATAILRRSARDC
jgi:hypothetical protein